MGHLVVHKAFPRNEPFRAPNVVEFVEYCKLNKPSTYNSEIREALVGSGICTVANVPPHSTISNILRKDLNFTYKNLSVCPEELLSKENLISIFKVLKLHGIFSKCRTT